MNPLNLRFSEFSFGYKPMSPHDLADQTDKEAILYEPIDDTAARRRRRLGQEASLLTMGVYRIGTVIDLTDSSRAAMSTTHPATNPHR